MTTFSERLTNLRKDKKLGKTKLAEQLNISLSEYDNYENGISYPENETLAQMAKLLNTSTYYLTGKASISSLSEKEQSDIEYSLDHAISFDNRPMDDHDRKIIRNLLEKQLAGEKD